MTKKVNEPNTLSEDTKKSMKTRLITAGIGLAIIIPLLFLGNFFIMGLVLLFLIVGVKEIVSCSGKRHSIWLYIACYIFSTLLTFWPIIFRTSIPTGNLTDSFYSSFLTLHLSVSVVSIAAFVFFFVVVIDRTFIVRDACFIFTMIIMLSLGLQSILFLRFYPVTQYSPAPSSFVILDFNTNLKTSLLLVYVVLGTFVTDAGAYFVGVFFGKNKMNERISPKKTWEGFAGGVIISTIISSLFAIILAANGTPVISLLDLDHWYLIIILSLTITLMATLGDFVFSSIKRFFEIKDFGNLLPGHGGVLDRLDSLIFSMISSSLFISLFDYWSTNGNLYKIF